MTARTKPSKYAVQLPREIEKKEIEDYDRTLLYRLGGEDALEAVLEMFFKGLLQDDLLKPFFHNANPALIKYHQKKFLALAFTEIPADFDAKAYIIERHFRLFANGLNETHFDRVVVHLEAALSGMWVDAALIAETKEHVAPLRAIFEESGREHVTEYLKEAVGSDHFNNRTIEPKSRPTKIPKFSMFRFPRKVKQSA
ncbi:unnamed protein product [Cylindrotheca closterium]|uniref:Globin n=1 Tax=Cylindrotheca closterium TaxID=2856 RepID=A0AAD2FZ52_9STRA|nr:unnamed protein product [Cylindrotheca closterium]